MITVYDYLNIGFYLIFLVGVGVYFARKSRDTSDYFRGGGVLPWWITGTSAWMAGFTAWTFTGAAGKIYETGTYVLGLYYSNVIPLIVLFLFACHRFRRLRVVTPLEAVRLRFGAGSQQFYTWVRLPIMMVFGAFGLNSVSVFMGGLLGVDLTLMIIAMGVIVTFVSMLGGALGVAASDFVQMLLVVTVTAITAVLALALPEIGGVSGLVEKVPPVHFDWSQVARPEFMGLWFLALTFNTTFARCSLSDDQTVKYMMTRSDRDAKLMVVIPIAGALLGPLIWMIPSMASAVIHPDLAAKFPMLNFANEAAFLAMASDVLPQGMIGLLMCAIFAATLTTMDASVNQGAGIFVRNFYLPIVNPRCPERKLLIISKVVAGVFGATIVVIAVLLNRYRSLGLFDLLNQIGVSLLMPLAVPACLGLFYKRTPGWSAWSTVLVGFAMAFAAKYLVTIEIISAVPGLAGPYSPEEYTAFTLIATVALVMTASVAWFFFTSLFYGRASAAQRGSIEEFFTRLRTPLERSRVESLRENRVFPAVVGRLCLVYGLFISLFIFIPNDLSGRICYFATGGLIAGVGALLLKRYRNIAPQLEEAGNSPLRGDAANRQATVVQSVD